VARLLLFSGTPEAERGLKEYGVLAHTPVLGEDPTRLRRRVQSFERRRVRRSDIMENLALQSTGMRGRGLGWRAERCADPQSCELHLCVVDPRGSYWHPADPLAFARWRIRADVDAIPAHVMVRVSSGWEALRRGMMLSALGVGGTAAVLGGMWWGRQRRFSMKTLSGSES
jgi:hypothetical protein